MADSTERNEDLNAENSFESGASAADASGGKSAPEAQPDSGADAIPPAGSVPEVIGEDQPEETEEERAAREAEEELLWIFQSTIFDNAGQKIGRVGQVYLDDQTQAPNWVTAKTGLFGMKEFFIPLDGSERTDKRITVPFGKETVLAAPRTEVDQNLSPSEEDALYNHYQVEGKMTEVREDDVAPTLGEETEAAATETTSADDSAVLREPAAPWDTGAEDASPATESVAPWNRGSDEEPSESKAEFDALINDERPVEVPNEVFARPEEPENPTEETDDTDKRQ